MAALLNLVSLLSASTIMNPHVISVILIPKFGFEYGILARYFMLYVKHMLGKQSI